MRSPMKRSDARSKGDVKLWVKRQWCISEVSAEFVCAYGGRCGTLQGALRPEEAYFVLCRDALPDGGREACAYPRQTRVSRTLRPYEYERRGVYNLFMFFEPKSSWRHVDLRERQTARDFAQQMRKLADDHYPEAEKIRVVLDKLNTHTPAAL